MLCIMCALSTYSWFNCTIQAVCFERHCQRLALEFLPWATAIAKVLLKRILSATVGCTQLDKKYWV